MEDQRWLRLITIGLVLAAVAVGYFLFTGRFSLKDTKPQEQVSQSVSSPAATSSAAVSAQPTAATSKPSVSGQQTAGASPFPSGSPASAYNAIAQRTTKGGQPIQNLPRTGFPLELAGVLSASAILAGWGLRRFTC